MFEQYLYIVIHDYYRLVIDITEKESGRKQREMAKYPTILEDITEGVKLVKEFSKKQRINTIGEPRRKK
jgi:hypothetical protein